MLDLPRRVQRFTEDTSFYRRERRGRRGPRLHECTRRDFPFLGGRVEFSGYRQFPARRVDNWHAPGENKYERMRAALAFSLLPLITRSFPLARVFDQPVVLHPLQQPGRLKRTDMAQLRRVCTFDTAMGVVDMGSDGWRCEGGADLADAGGTLTTALPPTRASATARPYSRPGPSWSGCLPRRSRLRLSPCRCLGSSNRNQG